VVDVGADHGHVAYALGAVATERALHRRGRSDVRWVVADGLRPFRRVDLAVVGGMGADTIGRILAEGPRPAVVVVHAADDPPRLRRWLADHGWRIDAERLAREAGRFAEVIRAVPGAEHAEDLDLALGPRLLSGDDPLLAEHLAELRRYYDGLAASVPALAPRARFAALAARVALWQRRRGFA
jgi:tRNA A22 N-methylase